MRIAVCDDEAVFLKQLTEYIEKYYNSIDLIVDTFESGEVLLKKLINKPDFYDLIFLDIEMKQLDGIQTAKKIREYNKEVLVIFLTSHVEYATDGYEVAAFRFLVKPLQENKLIRALQDVQKEMDRNRKILIKDSDREILLRYQDIVYLEAQNVNVLIRTLNDFFVIRRTLVQMEEEIKGPSFFKSHRSYIVNIGFVIDYDNKYITMETGEKIVVSRSKLADFKMAMMNYVRSYGR